MDPLEINFKVNDSKYDVTPSTIEEILGEPDEDDNASCPAYYDIEDDNDANKTWNETPILTQEDDANLIEQLHTMPANSMEDYGFDSITNYAWL